MYIGLVHRRRKERYTQVLAREIREKESRLFAVAILPWSSPASVSVSLRSYTGTSAYSRAWLAGAALTKHSQTVSRKRAQPVAFFSSLALVFPRRHSENCDCTVKDDPFHRAKGEGKFARCCAVKCNMHEYKGEGEEEILYIMLEGNCRFLILSIFVWISIDSSWRIYSEKVQIFWVWCVYMESNLDGLNVTSNFFPLLENLNINC